MSKPIIPSLMNPFDISKITSNQGSNTNNAGWSFFPSSSQPLQSSNYLQAPQPQLTPTSTTSNMPSISNQIPAANSTQNISTIQPQIQSSAFTQTQSQIPTCLNQTHIPMIPSSTLQPIQPLFVMPPNWINNSIPATQTHSKLSFFNDTNNLQITITNSSQCSITTKLVGRGTKFDIEVPLDQNIAITVATSKNSKSPKHSELEEQKYTISQVDGNPFNLSKQINSYVSSNYKNANCFVK